MNVVSIGYLSGASHADIIPQFDDALFCFATVKDNRKAASKPIQEKPCRKSF
jgi:hypothetical protein